MALLWRRRVAGDRRNSFFRMQAAHVGIAHVDESAAFAKGLWPEVSAAKRGCGGARAPAAPLRGLSCLPSDDDCHGNTLTVSSAHPLKFVSCATRFLGLPCIQACVGPAWGRIPGGLHSAQRRTQAQGRAVSARTSA